MGISDIEIERIFVEYVAERGTTLWKDRVNSRYFEYAKVPDSFHTTTMSDHILGQLYVMKDSKHVVLMPVIDNRVKRFFDKKYK